MAMHKYRLNVIRENTYKLKKQKNYNFKDKNVKFMGPKAKKKNFYKSK